MKRTNWAVMVVGLAIVYLAITLSRTANHPNQRQATPPATHSTMGQGVAGNITVSGAYIQATVLTDSAATAGLTIATTKSIDGSMNGMSGMPDSPATTQAATDDMGSMEMRSGNSADSGPVSGAYLLIQNNSDQPDKLIAITCDAAETATLHQTIIKDDLASMQMLASLDIPAGGSVELKPGGYHIMLMNLKHPLVAGQRATLTLTFASGTSLTLQVPIVAP